MVPIAYQEGDGDRAMVLGPTVAPREAVIVEPQTDGQTDGLTFLPYSG